MKVSRKSWVLRLPRGIREQPGWVFIGVMCIIAGLSYLFGTSHSSAIAQILDKGWLKVWGGFLFLAGMLIAWSTLSRNRPLERLSLRLLSIGLLVYTGWVLAAVPLSRATIVVFMCACLIGLAEIRVAVLKILLRQLPSHLKEDV